jgi:hypothetical protein
MSTAELHRFWKSRQFGGLRPGYPSPSFVGSGSPGRPAIRSFSGWAYGAWSSRHCSAVNGAPLPSADSSVTLGSGTPPFWSRPASGTYTR